MKSFWKTIVIGTLSAVSLACRSETAVATPNDVGVSALMSDGVVLGSIIVSSVGGDAPGFISGHIHVTGKETQDFPFENVPANSLKECDGKKCAVLYYLTPFGKALTQSPQPALFRDEAIYREFDKIKNTSREKAAFLLSSNHCSAEMRTALDRLDGDSQQTSVDFLFSRPLSKEELLCLASQITSLAKLKKASFIPPYASSEGVYHHGFTTRGELVALLLPHLTKIAIVPSTFPLTAQDRSRLSSAWAYAVAHGADGAD